MISCRSLVPMLMMTSSSRSSQQSQFHFISLYSNRSVNSSGSLLKIRIIKSSRIASSVFPADFSITSSIRLVMGGLYLLVFEASTAADFAFRHHLNNHASRRQDRMSLLIFTPKLQKWTVVPIEKIQIDLSAISPDTNSIFPI